MKTLKGLLNLRQVRWRWVIALIVILFIIYAYYLLFIRMPYTTDAYVQANWLKVAARISGPVTKLYVKNNEIVKKGQILFEVDPTDYQLEVLKARAHLLTIKQKLKAIAESINVAKAKIEKHEAALNLQMIKVRRFQVLAHDNFISKERFDETIAQLNEIKAERKQAIHNLASIEQTYASAFNNGEHKVAQIELKLALKQLSYTKITSPVNGKLSNYYIRVGHYVKTGETLFSIVEDNYWWIQANYLEYELRRLKIGQKASIRVSMYPGKVFHGQIEAIGAAISRGRNISPTNILPVIPETINWLRLFSRFPVFIRITSKDKKKPLRIGATAAVIVYAR